MIPMLPMILNPNIGFCGINGNFSCSRRRKLRRALLRQAIPIGRSLRGRGRPILWVPIAQLGPKSGPKPD